MSTKSKKRSGTVDFFVIDTALYGGLPREEDNPPEVSLLERLNSLYPKCYTALVVGEKTAKSKLVEIMSDLNIIKIFSLEYHEAGVSNTNRLSYWHLQFLPQRGHWSV